MQPDNATQQPIQDVIDELRLCLVGEHQAVLQAPPGAGKTTIVPLSLLYEDWLAGQKILILEPRRMAARAAATRMAALLGEEVGQTVGYRVRLDSCVSDATRIEVITEGILTRRLQRDPGLQGVGLVIFDEFHERNLDADLCLALCLQGRELFREGRALKLLVMSATLDSGPVAQLLGNARIVTSAGRQYPVVTSYGSAMQLRDDITGPVVETALRALQDQDGSVLVFLPGQREISRAASVLSDRLRDSGQNSVYVAPLYGGLSVQRQQQAIAAAPDGKRKVVLSTNIAETSLTIEGVHAVVDSGLTREAVFDPATGMTRLVTRRISRASAEQRQGRAGRLGPGRCYRMWSEEQHRRLVAHAKPEILQADLAPLALQLMAWGAESVEELQWLDLPLAAPYQQAVELLEGCGAVFRNARDTYQLTPHGVRLAQMPLHPRLSHMLLVGCDIHATETACLLAAVLSERNPLEDSGVDLSGALALLLGETPLPKSLRAWFSRIWRQARRFARLATDIHQPRKYAMAVAPEDVVSVLLASAYPDRVGVLRDSGDGLTYQLSNGRSARLPANDALAGTRWLAAAELGGTVGDPCDRIYSASALNPDNFQQILSPLVTQKEVVEWDYDADQFVAQRRSMVGSILLATQPLSHVSDAARNEALLGVLRKRGLDLLPWSKNLVQWRARVMLMHGVEQGSDSNRWPDLSDEGLLASLEDWLLPYLGQVRRLEDFQKLDLKTILHALLPWPLPLELERLAPEHLPVPSGSSISIDYNATPPVLAVKLQEMFGCEETPVIAGGRVTLQVHLLSPAQRPLQVTQDLAGFWQGAYQEVKKEMRGRYPKHPWPDDPVMAVATAHTKKRAESS
tara:strand:+ start:109548 stop:112118 length:2571 start_codon:yes stop_codon:yes gene_type:complete